MEKNNFFINYTGKVRFVTKTQVKQNKSGANYSIRSLAVDLNDTNPKYPVTLVFDVLGNDQNMKKINMLDSVTAGQEIGVTFTLNSSAYIDKEGQNKFFLKLNLISITDDQMNQDQPQNYNQAPPVEEDDLPF